jgi:hypothetical protein
MYNEPELGSTTRRGNGLLAAIGTWIATFAISLLLFMPPGLAQGAGEDPFANMIGSWSGSGTISLSSGTKERIRCNARYNLVFRADVRLQITCASDSYKFQLEGEVVASGNSLSGTWSEMTRGVAGKIVGSISGDHIKARAEGQTFTALFTMTTRGNRQSVFIESPGSEMTGIRITLSRRSR